jgi:hypothetical protein
MNIFVSGWNQAVRIGHCLDHCPNQNFQNGSDNFSQFENRFDAAVNHCWSYHFCTLSSSARGYVCFLQSRVFIRTTIPFESFVGYRGSHGGRVTPINFGRLFPGSTVRNGPFCTIAYILVPTRSDVPWRVRVLKSKGARAYFRPIR